MAPNPDLKGFVLKAISVQGFPSGWPGALGAHFSGFLSGFYEDSKGFLRLRFWGFGL